MIITEASPWLKLIEQLTVSLDSFLSIEGADRHINSLCPIQDPMSIWQLWGVLFYVSILFLGLWLYSPIQSMCSYFKFLKRLLLVQLKRKKLIKLIGFFHHALPQILSLTEKKCCEKKFRSQIDLHHFSFQLFLHHTGKQHFLIPLLYIMWPLVYDSLWPRGL